VCDQLIEQSIDRTWPIDRRLATFLLFFYAIDQSIKQSIATGQSTVALPPSCSFFVLPIKIKQSIATGQSTTAIKKSIIPRIFIVWNSFVMDRWIEQTKIDHKKSASDLIFFLFETVFFNRSIDCSFATFLLFVFAIDGSIKRLNHRSQLHDWLWPIHLPALFFVQSINPIRPCHLPALFLGLINRPQPHHLLALCFCDRLIDLMIDHNWLADWLQPCHLPVPPFFLFYLAMDWSLCFFFWSDQSIHQSIHRNCQSTTLRASALLPFLLLFYDWSADQPQPCHPSYSFFLHQSITIGLFVYYLLWACETEALLSYLRRCLTSNWCSGPRRYACSLVDPLT